MNNEFSLKELYEVSIKATYPIEVSGKIIEPHETIAVFDKITLANFTEVKKLFQASGGYDNRGLVFWDTTKEVQLNFIQGIFSKTQLALLTNAKLIQENNTPLIIAQREEQESDENGLIKLTHSICETYPYFVYNNGEKINTTKIDDKTLQIYNTFTSVIIDYYYNYANGYTELIVGQTLTQGFLELKGKTRVKDDITGQVHTGIITIPRLKLMSDLSIRLGQNATPVVGRLDAIALPTGDRTNTQVLSIQFLNDDIDSDL